MSNFFLLYVLLSYKSLVFSEFFDDCKENLAYGKKIYGPDKEYVGSETISRLVDCERNKEVYMEKKGYFVIDLVDLVENETITILADLVNKNYFNENELSFLQKDSVLLNKSIDITNMKCKHVSYEHFENETTLERYDYHFIVTECPKKKMQFLVVKHDCSFKFVEIKVNGTKYSNPNAWTMGPSSTISWNLEDECKNNFLHVTRKFISSFDEAAWIKLIDCNLDEEVYMSEKGFIRLYVGTNVHVDEIWIYGKSPFTGDIKVFIEEHVHEDDSLDDIMSEANYYPSYGHYEMPGNKYLRKHGMDDWHKEREPVVYVRYNGPCTLIEIMVKGTRPENMSPPALKNGNSTQIIQISLAPDLAKWTFLHTTRNLLAIYFLAV